jgi:predicted DsbA family dithiol-disulfide isomerase
MAKVAMTYYLDVLSSWCLIAEDALARARSEFGDRIDVEWRIAALRDSLGYTHDQLAWYFARTAVLTGVQLNADWLESTADGTRWANLCAEAARSLGRTDDGVRLALARAGLKEGKRMAQRDTAIDVASAASGIEKSALERAVDDPATAARIARSCADFAALGVAVRPTFVMKNSIGDAAILAGCWKGDVLCANIANLLGDQERYESFNAKNPPPPGAV